MTETRHCSDAGWHSHYENAAERLFPGVAVLSADQDAAVIAEALAEEASCEEHGR
jgi:hypothetical protein